MKNKEEEMTIKVNEILETWKNHYTEKWEYKQNEKEEGFENAEHGEENEQLK